MQNKLISVLLLALPLTSAWSVRGRNLRRHELDREIRDLHNIDMHLATRTGNTTTYPAKTFWLSAISHRGAPAFNSNSTGYKVFRNVRDYGAKGV